MWDPAGPCTEMAAYTRLCASKEGEPDGLEPYIPSVFVKQLTTSVLAKYGHFGVLNRPHSVVEMLKDPQARMHARMCARTHARMHAGMLRCSRARRRDEGTGVRCVCV